MITLTNRAAGEIKRIVAEQKLPDAVALRVGVKGGGCSGFSYTLGFDDRIAETDQVFEIDDVRVVCDPAVCGEERARSTTVTVRAGKITTVPFKLR